MCGWCFAIGPDLLQARSQLGDEVDWRLETGGLVTAERVRPIALDRDHLRQGFAGVEAVTGRRAGEAYWRDVVEPGTWVNDSEPAVRAVITARELPPGTELAFIHALTDALFLEGWVPDDPATLEHVAVGLGIDGSVQPLATGHVDAATIVARVRSAAVTARPPAAPPWPGATARR